VTPSVPVPPPAGAAAGRVRRRAATVVAVLATHAALLVWLTWPLAPNLATHRPKTSDACLTDPMLLSWALAHQSRALVRAPAEFPHGNVYHPSRYALFYGETAFGTLPYFMPTFFLTRNPNLALNLALLVCLLLTAAALHLVVVWWTGSQLGGFLAGWAFLTTRWVLWTWIPAAANYAAIQYFPLIIFVAAAPLRGRVRSLGLLALLVLQGLASVYIAAALFVPLGLLAAARCLRPTTRADGLRLVAAMAGALVILALPYTGYLLVRRENPALLAQTAVSLKEFYETISPKVAVALGPLGPHAPTGVPVAALALIVCGAAVFAARPRAHAAGVRTAWAHGAFWTAVGTYISLRPLSWPDSPLSLPHRLLAGWLPLYRILRAPERLGIGALMGLCILAGAAFATGERRLAAARFRTAGARAAAAAGRIALAAVVATAMYAGYAQGLRWPIGADLESLPASYPLEAAISPEDIPFFPILRPPGGPLLELPLGRDSRPHAAAMYRSIFHRRRILNGYHGYWPADFPARMALARRLPDPEALAELRRETGLELILVHALGLRPAQRAEWLALADRGGRPDLRLVARDGLELLFRVDEPHG
jgi:hypothetical protein